MRTREVLRQNNRLRKIIKVFGEMGVVRSISLVKAKFRYQGKTCMFLGYAKNHTGGTYRKFRYTHKTDCAKS